MVASPCFLDLQAAIAPNPILVTPETSVQAAIAQMHQAHATAPQDRHAVIRASCVVVTEGGQCVGLLTERDVVSLVAAAQQSLERLTLGQVMTHPVTLRKSACRDTAIALKVCQAYPAVVILDEQDCPVGLITPDSLAQTLRLSEKRNYQRTEDYLAAQNDLLAKIAQDKPLSEVLHRLIGLIEQQLDGALCSILLLDEENQLRCIAAPSLPPDYNRAVEGAVIGEGVGSCGTAAFRGETVIVSDIAHHPFWEAYKDIALGHGLQASWSNPIIASDGRVLGTFGVYYTTVRSPEAFELELLSQTANIAGIAIEREQSTTALRDSEAKFHRLVDNVPGIIYRYILHPDGSDAFTFLSPYTQELLGVDPTIFMQDASLAWSRVNPEDMPHITRKIGQSAQEGSPFFAEYRLLAGDGTWRWMKAIARPAYQENGDVLWDGIMLDISDRKQAEQQLQELNQYLEDKIERRTKELLEKRHFIERITESSTVVLYIYDLLEQRNIYCNRQITEILGYSPEAIQAMGSNLFATLVHPEDLPFVMERMEQYLTVRGSDILDVEYRMRHANGEWRWLQSRDRVFRRTADGLPWQMIGTATDISDRKRAELALQASEAKLSSVLSGVSGLVLQFRLCRDCTREYIYYSTGTEAFYGYSPQEMLEDQALWQSRVHPEDFKTQILPSLEQLLEGQSTTSEYRFFHRDGTLRWIGATANSQWDESAHCWIVTVVEMDISDRKRVEQQIQQLNANLETKVVERTAKLQEREQFLQTVLDTFPLSVFWKNQKSEYLGCNRNFLRDAGLTSVEDLIGKTDYDLPWQQTEAEDYRADDQQVIQSNCAKIGIVETQMQADGNQIWIETNKLPLYNLQGEVVGVLGTYQDISEKIQLEVERQKFEAELTQSRQKYYALIQSVNGIVWEYDLCANRFTFVSDKAEALLGYPISAWLTEKNFWKNHVYPEDIPVVEKRFDDAIQRRENCEMEYRMVAADGRIVWLYDISTFNKGEKGGLTTSGILIDIRDRKQAEAQLQQTNRELIRATRMKDEFLANMSHELRTPLNAVLGMAEGLQEGIFGDINSAQLKALQTIERSGSHLLELINDILDLAKVASGRIELHCTATAVIPLCQSSLVFIRQQALKKQIQIETKLPSNLPDLWVDERYIRQVLINLLSNAVKFTPEGGQITLEVSHIATSLESGEREARNFLCISVTDTGIGIATPDLAKLFQPFVQIDSALNRKYSGTGLGLALVKSIVELHSGQVSVTSEVDVGSQFSILLPCAEASSFVPMPNFPHRPENAPCSPLQQSSPLVLLAEDNDANLNTLSSYLRAKGYRLQVARTGQEAIALAQADTPDVILMDVQMPQMDGLEAIRQIRQRPNLAEVPIIALTGLAMAGDRERCLAAGANDYLSKPVKLKQLTALIQNLLAAQVKTP